MRTCKICNVQKEYIYFTLNSQGRALYKHGDKIWHGKKCSDCHTAYVQSKSNKQHLGVVICEICKKEFKQKTIKQKKCSNC